jgi:anti-sigma factor RsiW
MPLSPDHCPPDPEETANLYLLGGLVPEDAAAFEDHFITCPACAKVVDDADVFIRAIRAGAQGL